MGTALAYRYDDYNPEPASQGQNNVCFFMHSRPKTQHEKFTFTYPKIVARQREENSHTLKEMTIQIRTLSKAGLISAQITRLTVKPDYDRWGEVKPSDEVVEHAISLVRNCKDEAVWEDCKVTTGGNGTVMLLWQRESLLATLDIGARNFTFAVLNRETYQKIGGGESNTDDRIDDFYKLLV